MYICPICKDKLIKEFITTYGNELLYTIITTVLTYVGLRIKTLYEKHVNDSIKKNIIDSIINKSQIDKNTLVIEIGPGAGSLTYKLSSYAKNVLCYEIDTTLKELLEEEILNFDKLIEETTIKVILNGEYDDSDVILEIHPGAGGTESMDWALMLFRMYQRYCQNHNYKFKVIDYLAGDEAGIKSVTINISGKNAYGMLKGERGVHRLVRISPFDTNKRRHTSFASVDISPVIKDTEEIKINDQDLKIDTFCASGPGGQGVNTTYSAVRITHKPTGIVVNCQNERSQIQNREQAMMVLISKLMELKIQQQEEELAKIKGGSSAIAFGSQIRSYVFCPYTLVKDHRSNVENGNVNAVMDGDLDSFIYGYLKWMCNK